MTVHERIRALRARSFRRNGAAILSLLVAVAAVIWLGLSRCPPGFPLFVILGLYGLLSTIPAVVLLAMVQNRRGRNMTPDRQLQPDLCEFVEGIAAQVGVASMPVYLGQVETAQVAFFRNVGPAVTLSQRWLAYFAPAQTGGVIAHELAHISFMHLFARQAIMGLTYSLTVFGIIPVMTLISSGIGLLALVGYVLTAPFVAHMIGMWLQRLDELEADTAAALAGHADGLCAALIGLFFTPEFSKYRMGRLERALVEKALPGITAENWQEFLSDSSSIAASCERIISTRLTLNLELQMRLIRLLMVHPSDRDRLSNLRLHARE